MFSLLHTHCKHSADGDKLLVGTAGCEIYDLSATDGSILHGLTGPLIAGHGRYSPVTAVTSKSPVDDDMYVTIPATALAVHPSKRAYATAGAAGRVRIWDADTRCIPYVPTCLCVRILDN